jgi:hypothetical protein
MSHTWRCRRHLWDPCRCHYLTGQTKGLLHRLAHWLLLHRPM